VAIQVENAGIGLIDVFLPGLLGFNVIQAGLIAAAGLLFRVHLDLSSMFVVTMLGYLVLLAAGFAISGWVRDPQRAPVVASSIGLPLVFIGLLPMQFFSGPAAAVIRVLANLVRNPRPSPARAGRGMASHHDGRSGSGRLGGGPPGSRQQRVHVGPGLIRICRGHRH
jgi:hypothetical protein